MACGLPYAIAAQVAYPDRQCVAFVGDGGFSMLMADFVTAVKYKLPIKVVIIKNNTLGQIKWEQMVFLGNPEYGVELHPIDFAAFAHACGGIGFTVEDPADCGRVIGRVFECAGACGAASGRRSAGATNACEDQSAAGAALRGIARSRGTESQKDCAHCALGQSARNDLG